MLKWVKEFIGFPSYIDGESIEMVLRKQKLRLVVLTASVIAVLITILSVFRLLIGEASGHQATIWLVPGFCIVVILLAKFAKSEKAAIWALNIALFILIPVRTYYTGGIYSVVLFWYIGHSVLIYTLNGKKFGYAYLVYGFASVVGFYFLNVPQIPVSYSNLNGIYKLFTLYTILFPFLFIINEKQYFAEALKKENARQTSFIILRRLIHEVGNAMNIAVGYIDIFEEEGGVENVEVVDRALERIENLMEDMAIVSTRTDITGFLKKYEKDPSLREALDKIKRF